MAQVPADTNINMVTTSVPRSAVAVSAAKTTIMQKFQYIALPFIGMVKNRLTVWISGTFASDFHTVRYFLSKILFRLTSKL